VAWQADSNGVIYDGWRVSGHFTAFDREQVQVHQGSEGRRPELPRGVDDVSQHQMNRRTQTARTRRSESYSGLHDKWDTLGLGKDAPMYSSVNTDSMELFQPSTKQFITLRVPIPQLFARSGTGRVDNPSAGWKGKGFWSSYSTYASWHIEVARDRCRKRWSSRCDPTRLPNSSCKKHDARSQVGERASVEGHENLHDRETRACCAAPC